MQQKETTMMAGVAKTAFKEMLDRVECGETIRIIRYGKVVARVSPETSQTKTTEKNDKKSA